MKYIIDFIFIGLLGTIIYLINKNSKTMSQQLDQLKEQVQHNSDVCNSAIQLLNGLKQQLDDAIASGDPAQVQALSDQLGEQTQHLADAIVANTPAENEPTDNGGGGDVVEPQ